jgi:hypothetical protein
VLTETFTEVPAAVEVTDDAKSLKVDTGKKIDVLDKQTAVFTNPNKNAGTSELPKLTDGVYAKAGGNCYFNTSWIKKADVEGAKSNYNASTLKTKSGGDITFNGVDGQKYLYSFEFKDLGKDTGGVKADSFALWINNNTYYADDEAWACQQFDCEFDILVSTDGGQTYQKAWSSVRYQEKANGRFPFVGANLLKSQGGNMKNGKYVFADGSVAQYRYISEKFNKAYEGVTNIVYATSVPRVQQKFIVPYSVTNDAGETYEETFFSYVCRISEFDVYDSSNAGGSASAATGDYSVYMIVALVAVAAVALGGIVIVRRRRREN